VVTLSVQDNADGWGPNGVRTLRLRVTACGLAALALALVGCTDDRVRPSDTLPPLPSSTATTAETTEDLPGPPGYPFPPEALEYTEAGALAFFNYYIDLLNKTTETLDSEPLRLLAGPDCQGCESRVEMYDADRAAGLRYDGGSTTVAEDTLSVQLRPDVQGGLGARINTGVTGSALTVFDASGVAVAGRAYPAYDLSISVSVAWFPAQLTWQVASLSLVVA
jgi:hypothetical protein